MKKLALLSGMAALLFVGCASNRDREHFARYHNHTDYYGDHPVAVSPGDRVYVREYDSRYDTYDRDYDDWRHREYRGKHPDALGWNDPYWNR